MRSRLKLVLTTICLIMPAISFANEIGVGFDGPTSQPPSDTTTASESLLQEMLDWFDMDVEQEQPQE